MKKQHECKCGVWEEIDKSLTVITIELSIITGYVLSKISIEWLNIIN